VIVTRRPKYACGACKEAVVQAPAPARLIEGGLPTERLVAHVVVAKYADHCPLYTIPAERWSMPAASAPASTKPSSRGCLGGCNF
jgi:transposase